MNSESEQIRAGYDALPYLLSAIPRTSPDNLNTTAALAGFEATPVIDCRVLEIGCATGQNLLPMALALPGSRFLGIDLSPAHIDIAQKALDKSGLKNIQFRCQDMMEFGADEGPFDYIIAHGIYSWVPGPVRDRLWEICAKHLSARGLVYISYATLPGCHLMDVFRDMMRFHARNETDARRRVIKGREILEIGRLPSTGWDSYKNLLKVDGAMKLGMPDWYLIHDDMAEVNNPVYFLDFVREAAKHGMSYLADAEPTREMFHLFSQQLQEELRSFSANMIELLQYADFKSGQTFRSSVLCRTEAARTTIFEDKAMGNMYVASSAARESTTTASGQPAMRFKSMTTPHVIEVVSPHLLRIINQLNTAWPQALPVAKLLEAETKAAGGNAEMAGNLARHLSGCYRRGIVELWTRPTDFIGGVGEKPIASPIVRMQATQGSDVVNLRHQKIPANQSMLILLRLLDGTHTQADLLNQLRAMIQRGIFKLESPAGLAPSTTELESILKKTLRIIEQNSLLMPG